jgi:hypothetical protein
MLQLLILFQEKEEIYPKPRQSLQLQSYNILLNYQGLKFSKKDMQQCTSDWLAHSFNSVKVQHWPQGIMNNNFNTYTDINWLAELLVLEYVLILGPTSKSATEHSCHLNIRLLGIISNSESEQNYKNSQEQRKRGILIRRRTTA